MKAVIYDLATGRIDRSVSGSADQIPIQCLPSEGFIISSGKDDTHYVDLVLGAVQEKIDYPLETLPLPCTVIVEGVEYPCTEQPTFSFDPPGLYEITVEAGLAYLRKTFEYEQL